MDEIGRAGWFTIGVTTLALAGAGRAVAGTSRIAMEMLRTTDEERRAAASGGRTIESASGTGGWVLYGALILAGAAVHHVLAGTRTIVEEILEASPQ